MLLLLLACTTSTPDDTSASLDSASPGDACDELPVGQVSLPADDSQHEESVEWWYWTGHLADDQGRTYGFEQAAFVFQIGGYLATSVHVALTDLDADRFLYDIAYVHGEIPDVIPSGFDIAAEGDRAVGGNGSDSLVGVIPDAAAGFQLELADAKAPVLHHGDGYHDYDVGGYTWYYSRPRMDVTGTVTVDGEDRPVTGSAWFDHQWGDLLAASGAGWDWFALQLDDGRELMLFMVQGSDELVGGTLVDAGCHATEIAAEDLQVTATGEWTSPTTGCTYPQGWTIQVGAERFQVDALLPEQELANDYDTYWEGACAVSGDVTGRAYVELAGRCG